MKRKIITIPGNAKIEHKLTTKVNLDDDIDIDGDGDNNISRR